MKKSVKKGGEEKDTCPDCEGEGIIINTSSKYAPCCGRCDGSGKIEKELNTKK